ncbi:hypothetical protein ABID70_002185 [Clavibacter michiganensis]|uniref:DUF1016 N-terminal domain-containing protein n=1 Tax=Clavibacter michiganensis TaxID=28447 RepID=UPI001AE6BE06|nr:DUF1016 N-terminal domain-containing protein [Clavibacter michiganensis]MBP2456661.1 hypothetical protein [Clavibacter michiganensis]MDQ0409231.1 hypothetical protein [Clavibacter michiganensis]
MPSCTTASAEHICALSAVLAELYWSIGQTLAERQEAGGWGTDVLNRIADDLRDEVPEMMGFSRSNLKYIRLFAKAWPDLGQRRRLDCVAVTYGADVPMG